MRGVCFESIVLYVLLLQYVQLKKEWSAIVLDGLRRGLSVAWAVGCTRAFSRHQFVEEIPGKCLKFFAHNRQQQPQQEPR